MCVNAAFTAADLDTLTRLSDQMKQAGLWEQTERDQPAGGPGGDIWAVWLPGGAWAAFSIERHADGDYHLMDKAGRLVRSAPTLEGITERLT